MRPWYRSHINWFAVNLIILSCAALWGAVEIIQCGYFDGIYLFLAGSFILFRSVKWLWSSRHPWIYETYKGRNVKVTPRSRDSYDVCIDGLCLAVIAEIFEDNIGYGRAIDFSRMIMREGVPMTWDERIDVLNILLEDFESRGVRVSFDNENLPDTSHVRAALRRMGKEFSKRQSEKS